MEPQYKNIISFVWSRDIKRSINFYCNILGFNRAFESQGWVELSIPGLKTGYLALNRWAKREDPPVNQFITLGVEDLEQFKAHLLENDVELRGDVTEFYEEGMKMLKFLDPDENVITAAEVEM